MDIPRLKVGALLGKAGELAPLLAMIAQLRSTPHFGVEDLHCSALSTVMISKP